MNIVDTAQNNGNFSLLVASLKVTGLASVLSGEGPFTVFAPNDEAFAKLPDGTIDNLLSSPERLKEILTYHVVTGKVMSSSLPASSSAVTVNGQEVSITVSDKVRVNDSVVITPDIECSNGVIHVIDSVLMPQ